MLQHFARDRRPVLASLQVPLLFVATRIDAEAGNQRALIRAGLAASIRSVDAGHALFVDQPEAFNQLVSGFLRTSKL
jgi:pimeloyl-ACP methyl ester carboxylesterase